jgi:hypothetical protein
MSMRLIFQAGQAAATTPTTSAAASCSAIVSPTRGTPGTACPADFAKAAASGSVSSTPGPPPSSAMSRLSPNSSRTTKPGGKPSAFSVAYSASRSRAVIVMVLAITAMMMTTMMMLTACSATRMASLIETKLSWKAFSVSVSVSASELRNCSSMRCEITGALLGSSMPTTYTPT